MHQLKGVEGPVKSALKLCTHDTGRFKAEPFIDVAFVPEDE